MEKNRTAVILLSRQHLRPSLKDEWVQKLLLAVNYVKSAGLILNSSVGSPNWEFITAAAAIKEVPLNLFLPITEPMDFESAKQISSHDFDLSHRAVHYEMALPIVDDSNKREHWLQRNRVLSESSDIVIPVSVRAGGSMSQFLESAKRDGREVVSAFQITHDNSSAKLSYKIIKQIFSDSITKIGRTFLVHWTRASNGPWPREKRITFYREVLESTAYPRAALCTLGRILSGRLIIASAKNMPGRTPTVSFSGLAPVEAVRLMKYRAHYQQMSFEPYGIGIERKTAMSMGIGEVRYYQLHSHKDVLNYPDWLTQSRGKITDWRNEEEFRYKGDFDLKAVPTNKLIAVCFHRDEATELTRFSGIRTLWFCD